MALSATYVDADTFTVATDKTASFVVGRRVKCDCGGDGIKYGTVLSSSYGAPNTTVNLTAASDDLTANLTTVDWGVPMPGTSGTIPQHAHTTAEGDGGQLAGTTALTNVPAHDHTGDAGDGAQIGWGAVSTPTFTAAPGADHTVSGITITLTAAVTVNFGDVCYIASTGKAALVDADAIASASGLVMAAATIAADAAGTFLLLGVARDDTWAWTVGGLIFITVTGTTGNTLSQTAPTGADDVIQIVGVATHADRMLFMPNLIQIEHL